MRHSKGWTRNRKKISLKQEFLSGNPMICSLDLSKKKHAFRVSDRGQNLLARGRLSHLREGVERLLEELQELRRRKGYDRIVFFMEGASHFWMPIASLLERRGYGYRLVLNRSVKHQRHVAGGSGDRNDPVDAGHIGDLANGLHFSFTQLPKEENWILLRALACEYQELVDLATAEKNRIHAFLETSFCGYYDIFSDPFSESSLAILQTLPKHGTVDETGFIDEVRKVFTGKSFQVKRAKKVLAYLHCGDPWGYIEGRNALSERLALAAQRLQIILAQQRQTREKLLAVYRQIPYSNNIDTIAHSSPLENAVLLGIMGDPRGFDDSRTVVHLAGLNPGDNRSGDFKGETRITKAGRARLRRAAINATMAVLRSGKNPDFIRRFFYLQKRTDRPLTALQALCACAGKYLRTVWWLCVNDKPYSSEIALQGFADKNRTEFGRLIEETVMELTT